MKYRCIDNGRRCDIMDGYISDKHPTKRINEPRQTDFTYFHFCGWGCYFLSTVLDDYSRYIITWKLFSTMSAADVKETLDLALEELECSRSR